MSKSKPSLREILDALKDWNNEAGNPRNDGWVQKGYKEKVKKVFNEAGRLLRKK